VSTLAIIIAVFVVLVVVLAIAGYVVVGRRRESERAALHAQAREADQHLARAHAEDKGWERSGLEAAARAAYAQRHGREPAALTLVQVLDRPGIEEDEAVFDADGERLVLGRRGGDWVAAS
jgi:flagellar biosynthesis/type III secretory pathway M-ring protein FliF/YscJ